MERRRILPGISATSIDSWDMENVKYLRKFSSGTPIPASHFPHHDGENKAIHPDERFGNEEQFLHYDETVVISANQNSRESLSRRVSGEENSRIGIQFDSGESSALKTDMDKYGTTKKEPLDDCYLLDVVTVRNESVLASRISPMSKPRLGSDGYETASSVGSSIDEPSFFHTDAQNDSGESFSGDYSGRPSFLSAVSEPRISITGRPTSSCPYCGELISITSDSMASDNVYLEQIVSEDAKLDLQPTFGDVEETAESSDRTSPYYVRLRRDLYLPTCNSPLRTPRNFSVDQKGQLLIDYKANWDGLEKYIESLKMCN